MLPESAEPVVALTARPEKSEDDKQSSSHLTNALHVVNPVFTRYPFPLRLVLTSEPLGLVPG